VIRWVQAWTPAITFCVPLALDLANHERGRHETHRYAFYVVRVCVSHSTITRSLVMRMEETGLNEDCKSFRVRNSSGSSAPSREVGLTVI